ncbi:predicted protein [Sclerotinia sclerotiorum 1980 UF-70]|uniref:Uncharacterized protein n=1 Tax=Sclerotinia sclerotiorum (strain ATCC 18683 / 1980 / Ss-1) TaxID=665079 RepID=A7EAX5_SCLS1|nr:predicted protein [Sclerotinia sclerotiorum 1980 UF-70]EDN99603.1 predicted protein [Sclerotinia sclerotiorum 1980 UF-70]
MSSNVTKGVHTDRYIVINKIATLTGIFTDVSDTENMTFHPSLGVAPVAFSRTGSHAGTVSFLRTRMLQRVS